MKVTGWSKFLLACLFTKAGFAAPTCQGIEDLAPLAVRAARADDDFEDSVVEALNVRGTFERDVRAIFTQVRRHPIRGNLPPALTAACNQGGWNKRHAEMTYLLAQRMIQKHSGNVDPTQVEVLSLHVLNLTKMHNMSAPQVFDPFENREDRANRSPTPPRGHREPQNDLTTLLRLVMKEHGDLLPSPFSVEPDRLKLYAQIFPRSARPSLAPGIASQLGATPAEVRPWLSVHGILAPLLVDSNGKLRPPYAAPGGLRVFAAQHLAEKSLGMQKHILQRIRRHLAKTFEEWKKTNSVAKEEKEHRRQFKEAISTLIRRDGLRSPVKYSEEERRAILNLLDRRSLSRQEITTMADALKIERAALARWQTPEKLRASFLFNPRGAPQQIYVGDNGLSRFAEDHFGGDIPKAQAAMIKELGGKFVREQLDWSHHFEEFKALLERLFSMRPPVNHPGDLFYGDLKKLVDLREARKFLPLEVDQLAHALNVPNEKLNHWLSRPVLLSSLLVDSAGRIKLPYAGQKGLARFAKEFYDGDEDVARQRMVTTMGEALVAKLNWRNRFERVVLALDNIFAKYPKGVLPKDIDPAELREVIRLTAGYKFSPILALRFQRQHGLTAEQIRPWLRLNELRASALLDTEGRIRNEFRKAKGLAKFAAEFFDGDIRVAKQAMAPIFGEPTLTNIFDWP